MNKLKFIIPIGICILSFSFLCWVMYDSYRPKVQQEINVHLLETYVWYDGDIVECWFDSKSKVTEGLILKRQKQGDSVLNVIKKLKR